MLRVKLSLSLLLSCAFLQSHIVFAQEVDESELDKLDQNNPAPLVVETPGARELHDALRRIAQQPNNVDALIDAGKAALLLDDANGALNFFTRANGLSPSDGRIKAGLATASVLTENPFEALRLFDEAIKLGVPESSIAQDRGLAFDLLGNFARAQQDYILARKTEITDNLIIRQAVSLSLSGNKIAADNLLVPLLQKENPDAWRARAFMLAARGEFKDSTRVATSFLDPASERKLESYLRLMPQLTGAQQIAAIHFGHFPIGYDIGHDSDAMKQMATVYPAQAVGDARLIPVGNPLGSIKNTKPEKIAVIAADPKTNLAAAAPKPVAAVVIKSDPKLPRDIPVMDALLAAKKTVDEPKPAVIAAAKPEIKSPIELPKPIIMATAPAPIVVIPKPVQIELPKIAVNLPAPVSAPTPAPEVQTIKQSLSPTPVPPAIINVAMPERPAVANYPSEKAIVETKVAETVAKPAVANVAPPTQWVAGTSALQGPFAAPPPSSAPVPEQVVVIAQASPANVNPTPTDTAPKKDFDLGAVVAAIEIPETEQQPKIAAVDLKKVKAAKIKADEKAKLDKIAADKQAKIDAAQKEIADKKALAKSSPARIWVQVATGTDVKGLSFDFKKLSRKNSDLFNGLSGYTSPWGRSNRLVVGPFKSMNEAKKFETAFHKAGGSGFVWNSESGTPVDPLRGK